MPYRERHRTRWTNQRATPTMSTYGLGYRWDCLDQRNIAAERHRVRRNP